MNDLSDMFGTFPHRPDTETFWRLSEIVLKWDAAMSDADDIDKVFDERASAFVDVDSLTYMASQRAFRALDIETREDLAAHLHLAIMLTGAYMEAFLVGAEYERGWVR